jgi:hypothetical protein
VISPVKRRVMSLQVAGVATAMLLLVVLYGGLAVRHIG